MNTTEQGDAFRDKIRRLIELTPGCSNVETEVLVGTQPVDIFYEELTSFSSMRVACECKDYKNRLTKDYITSHIFPRYSPLLRNGLVDAVRIIAPLALNATALAYVKEIGFTFQTPEEVASKVMDFRLYLRGLVTAFEGEGLANYYIPQTIDAGVDLQRTIMDWVIGNSARPIAILAGYGMGKTSFARRLASLLAADVSEPDSRIPILIPLSEISAEQDLEGLLGKLLAAHNHVRGYHFETFMEFNRQGRFVIILDGFDEMKHTISWGEFQHNFSELNRLNGTDTRVLLLGRPSALLSEDEELFVLRGKRREGSKTYQVPDAPEYRELMLQPFSSDQALDFIRRYAKFRSNTDSHLREAGMSSEDLEARIDNIRGDAEMMLLVLRPVQAKMLADLAIDPGVEWRPFGRFELYKEFIQRITSRELQKPTRSAFDLSARLQFIRRLAWWVWNRSSASGFSAESVPEALTKDLHARDPGASAQSIRRDLISGSLLEKKTGDNYYFPHRSFLEFLVAELICSEGVSVGAPTREELSSAMSPEVCDFIRESGRAAQIASLAIEIDEEKGSLTADFLKLLAWALNIAQGTTESRIISVASPRSVLIDYYRSLYRPDAPVDVAHQLTIAFHRADDNQSRLAVVLALLYLQSDFDALRENLTRTIVGLVLLESLDEMSRLLNVSKKNPIAIEKRNSFVQIMAGTFNGLSAQAAVTVHFGALYDQLTSAMEPKWRLSQAPQKLEDAVVIKFKDLPSVDKRFALSEKGAVVTSFFRRFPNPSNLVPVISKPLRQKQL